MNTDKVILADNCEYSSDCEETQLNNNILVVGGSGSGKSMSIAEPRLLETKHTSLIFTLSKRKLIHKYAPLLLRRGYQLWDLNFASPENSNIAYDPIQYVKNHNDIRFLAKSIVMANPRKEFTTADPYWDDGATSLLSAIIADQWKKGGSFADVLEMIGRLKIAENKNLIVTTLDSNFEILERKEPGSFAVNCWNSFKQLPIKTAACMFSALNVTLDTLFTPELRRMMAMPNKVKFEDLASKRTVLFVTTSAVNPSLNSFVNMFYAQAIKELFEYAEGCPRGVLPIPVHMLCDDFACGSRILLFPEYIAIFREKGISVTLMLQSESQLEAMYGERNTKTIINNCDTYVYMGGMDIDTCRHISVRLNWPLDDVMYMPIGQVVVFRRGERPVVTRRYNVTANPLYQEMCRIYEQRFVPKAVG